jgi:hypothetical protein
LNWYITELAKVKPSHLTEGALRAQDEAYIASLSKPKPVATPPKLPKEKPVQPAVPKLSNTEHKMLLENWKRLAEDDLKRPVGRFKAVWYKVDQNLGGKSGIDVKVCLQALEKLLYAKSEINIYELVHTA